MIQSLTGEDAELIKGIDVIQANYPFVVNTLRRYGDAGKIRQVLISRLESIKSPKYELSELKHFMW